MRTTSNPAFKNLPSGGYANFNAGQTQSAGFGTGFGQAPAAPQQTGRPMTIDDVVTKTATTLAVTVGTGAATYVVGGAAAMALALPAALIGFVLAMVVIFKKKVSPALVIAYAAVEGVFLGGISYLFGNVVTDNPGIIMQAIAGTVGVFAAMLVVYKTGAIRVTPKLTKWIIGALAGAVVLMLLNLISGFFVSGGLGLREPTPLGIGFSLLVIGIAAFSFLLDFDAADKAIKGGVDAKFAWYVAFGLMVTLVWLYLEILRLLSYFQNE
ncbi:putative YccA/Bax inhibitor family protein [Halopolyspora algeriensis]|uniref:Putative YccA/Bax inhibitor family protein n=1 Tax=Halopolyspora algeriensis TaxID=1500506 RepID=A0A368VLV3_9ACTN|nr:Bax inhibitor-1/YccA family protein [Halopolyspora algeriensis]RCW40005.1 putative YccA/Bax inhibitor family protein [Halopolyspora algeriensis]TQM46557.1 putative YccA/Bax inhibitor family protein [Halopolyspora algeriensis]